MIIRGHAHVGWRPMWPISVVNYTYSLRGLILLQAMMEELQWLRQQLLEQQKLLDVERLRRQVAERQVLELRQSLLSANQRQHAEEDWDIAKGHPEVDQMAEKIKHASEKETIAIDEAKDIASVKCEEQSSSPRSPGTSIISNIWNGVLLHVHHFQDQIDEGVRLILEKLLIHYALDNDIVFEKEEENLVGEIVSSGNRGDEENDRQGIQKRATSLI